MGDNKVPVSEFVAFVNAKSGRIDITGQSAEQILRDALATFGDEQVIAYEDARLEAKHNDFRLLMEEYHDGILLFELTDRKVWSRAVKDSTGLQAFWEENQANYQWKTRLNAVIYRCADATAAERIRAIAEEGGDVETERREMVSENPLSITIEESNLEVGMNPVIDAAFNALGKTGITEAEEVDGQLRFVEIRKVTEPAPKTLDEARGKVIADFQDYLEKTWIAELRAQYNHQVNREALHAIR